MSISRTVGAPCCNGYMNSNTASAVPRRRSSAPADPLDRAQLAGFATRKLERSRLEVEDLLEALDWALRHPATDPEPYAAATAAQGVVNQGWLAHPTDELKVLEQAALEVFDDPWTPTVDWSAFAPMAAAMGRSTAAGKALVNDALILAVRLPLLFEAVRSGGVEVWRARRIAQAVRMRPADVADEVDKKVTPIADSIGITRLEAIIDEAMLRLHTEERELELEQAKESWNITVDEEIHGFHGGESALVARLTACGDIKDLTAFEATASKIARVLGEQQHHEGVFPEPLEVRKARAIGILADPQLAWELLNGAALANTRTAYGMQLVVHLSNDVNGIDPIARIDGALGTRLAEQIATWCNRPEASFTVLPVVDLNQHTESTSSAVTDKMASRARLRTPTCVFPFCDRPSHRCDVDHRIPVGDGLGQHGSSCDCNLVPLCRHHHRLKTHAGWWYTPIEESVWLWSDPHGRNYLRDHHSTRDVTADPEATALGEEHAKRRDELRQQRIPEREAKRGPSSPQIKAGCRQPPDYWNHQPRPDDGPPPF